MPLSQQLLPRRDEQVDPSVVKAIDTGRYDVDGADILTFGLDMTCNLSCPSCRKERIVEKVSQATEKTRAIEEKLYPLLPSVKRLHINPAGELFASKPARRLLELIDDERCPNLILNIISNGTLFDETEWNRYPGIHGKVWTVRISTDAATKPTFEKLRRLGNYDVFLENARFLGSLRRSGRIGMLRFSFTYQVDNFREMIDFVEFVKSVGGDYALFERLHNNYRTFSDADFRQKEVHRRDHPLHADFIRIVNDPVFRDTKSVLHDFEFPGREKTVEEVSGARQRDVELRQRLEAFCNERKVAVPSDHYRQLDELSAFGVNS
jgi:MoaA/NifB/PqqE/SkfB family radical SAM enzyme